MSDSNGVEYASPDYESDGDAPSQDELTAAAEAHADANYLTWLAEQQLSKQSEDELAAQQDLRDSVIIDFRKVPPRERGPALEPDGTVREQHKRVDISKSIRAVDLLRLDLPPLRWVVPDLIPEGIALLATPPKIGKSSLVYQACVEIACGGSLLGRPVARGSVLYLALEDGPRRGQAKLRAALNGRTMPDRMDIWWNAAAIGEGLEEALAEWVAAHPDAVLIAIDTLERVRPAADMRKVGAYSLDVRHVAALQGAIAGTDVALLLVHHSRKGTSDDHVQAVSGTHGLTGSVDTIMGIERVRGEAYAIIRSTGREVGEIEIPATFIGGLWLSDKSALAAQVSPERLEVFEVIRKRGPIMALGVARALRRFAESDRVSIQQMMTKMAAEGVITRVKGGYSVSRSDEDYSDYSGDRKH